MRHFLNTSRMGGKRTGSGRKRSDDPNVPYIVQVKKSLVLNLGNDEIRKRLNEFVKGINNVKN